jgi:hypothetical protein
MILSNLLEDYSHCNLMEWDLKILQRFWSKVDIPKDYENECWIWTASTNKDGYGQFSINGKQIRSHRFSYECYNGPIPNGFRLLIRHSCDNPACVSPYHLKIGSYQDNSDDAVDRNRICCGENSPLSKLTEENVKDILNSLYENNINYKELSKIYNVHPDTIKSISLGNSWKHIYDQLTREQRIKIRTSTTKLTEEDVKYIFNSFLTNDTTCIELSVMYTVHPSTIRLIALGKSWRWSHIYNQLSYDEKEKIKYSKGFTFTSRLSDLRDIKYLYREKIYDLELLAEMYSTTEEVINRLLKLENIKFF